MEHLEKPRRVKGYGHTSLAEQLCHSTRRPYSSWHTVADSQVLKKVLKRVKMEVVVATLPCTELLSMTWGEVGASRLLGKVALLKQMSGWQQRSCSKSSLAWLSEPWVCHLERRLGEDSELMNSGAPEKQLNLFQAGAPEQKAFLHLLMFQVEIRQRQKAAAPHQISIPHAFCQASTSLLRG